MEAISPIESIELRESVSGIYRERFRSFEKTKIVTTGFAQVFLVSFQTYLISHEHFLPAMFVSFGISLIWSINVRAIVLGGWFERILYSGAAATGTIIGMCLSHILYQSNL